jgi:TolA-binding protein
MLSQALAGALQNPLLASNANAASAASSSGSSLNNQTGEQAENALATNMAAQIEAMNKKIEEGMAQLRFEVQTLN